MKTKATEIAGAMGVKLGPCLRLDGNAVDMLGSLELGKKVTFTIEGEIESVSQDQWSGKKDKHASVRISKIDGKKIVPEDDNDEDNQEEYDD